MPRKWPPCRCVDGRWLHAQALERAISEVAPQSRSTCAWAQRGEMYAWKRPPLPNVSPEPTTWTCTRSVSLATPGARPALGRIFYQARAIGAYISMLRIGGL
jgi:hypothetical protein